MESNKDKKVNKRLPVLDLAKSLSIIFMVFVHVLEVSKAQGSLVIRTTAQAFFQDLVEFLGGVPSAGIFILIMGYLIGWSTSSTSQKLIKGVGKLFALGVLVNVFEQWFPAFLGGNGFQHLSEVLPAILATDIYFFDALTMLCLALILLLKKEKRIPAAVGMIIVSMVLANGLNSVLQPTGSIWVDTLIGLFFRLNHYSYFPLFTWLPFPLLGYILGSVFKGRKISGKKFTTRDRILSVAIGIILTFGLHLLMKHQGIMDSVCFGSLGSDDDYYGLTWLNVLEGIGIVILMMNLFEGICCLTKGKIPEILSYLSANIMDIYIFQWVLIGFFAFVLKGIGNIYVNMLASVAVLVLSVVLTECKKRFRH